MTIDHDLLCSEACETAVPTCTWIYLLNPWPLVFSFTDIAMKKLYVYGFNLHISHGIGLFKCDIHIDMYMYNFGPFWNNISGREPLHASVL